MARSIDERIDALTMNAELISADIQSLAGIVREHTTQLATDADHIRRLARIAEIHERRLTDVEGNV